MCDSARSSRAATLVRSPVARRAPMHLAFALLVCFCAATGQTDGPSNMAPDATQGSLRLVSRRLADDFPVASSTGKPARDTFAERALALEVAWAGAWQSFKVCPPRAFGAPLDINANGAVTQLYDSRFRAFSGSYPLPSPAAAGASGVVAGDGRDYADVLNSALAVVCRQLGLAPQPSGGAADLNTQFVSVPLSLAPLFSLNVSRALDSPSVPRLDGLRCRGDEARVDQCAYLPAPDPVEASSGARACGVVKRVLCLPASLRTRPPAPPPAPPAPPVPPVWPNVPKLPPLPPTAPRRPPRPPRRPPLPPFPPLPAVSPPLPPAPSQPVAGSPPGAAEGSFRLVNGSSPSNGILEVMWQGRYRTVCGESMWTDIVDEDWPQAASGNLGFPHNGYEPRCLAIHVCAALGLSVSGADRRRVYLGPKGRPLAPLFAPMSGRCGSASEPLELVDGSGLVAEAARARAAAAAAGDAAGARAADAALRASPAYLAAKYRDPRLAQWTEEGTRCALPASVTSGVMMQEVMHVVCAEASTQPPGSAARPTRSPPMPAPAGSQPGAQGQGGEQSPAPVPAPLAPGDARLLPDGTLQLVNRAGQWGGVCEFDVDDLAAVVACRQMGLPYTRARAVRRPTINQFTPTCPPAQPQVGLALDIIACAGGERRLLDCNPLGRLTNYTFCCVPARIACEGEAASGGGSSSPGPPSPTPSGAASPPPASGHNSTDRSPAPPAAVGSPAPLPARPARLARPPPRKRMVRPPPGRP